VPFLHVSVRNVLPKGLFPMVWTFLSGLIFPSPTVKRVLIPVLVLRGFRPVLRHFPFIPEVFLAHPGLFPECQECQDPGPWPPDYQLYDIILTVSRVEKRLFLS